MPTIGTVFDVYLNINILLIVAFGIWTIVRTAMHSLGMQHAYEMKLRLVKGIVVISFIAPIFVALFDAYLRPTGAAAYSLSLSDLIVAQYLQGSLDIKAAELDSFLGLRTRMTEDFLSAQSIYSLTAMILLGSGLLIGSVRLLISTVHLRKILANSFTWRRFGRLHLLLSDRITTPFSTRGLMNRYIVLPTVMLENGVDQKIALGHELQHIRQNDTEWEIVLEVIRPFLFWNPAFILLKRQIEHLRELSCDQQVIARRALSVQDYCQCLLRTCERGLRKPELMVDTMPRVAFVQIDKSPVASNSAQFLRHRMTSLLEGERRQQRAATLLAVMVPVLGLVGFVSVMLQKPNDWSHDRIMFSTILNLDRLHSRNN